MPIEENKKYPLVARQFIWVGSKKDGKFALYSGPDSLDFLSDDHFVARPDPNNPGQLELLDKGLASQAIQDFVTLRVDEYAVIHNPVSNASDENPNGSCSAGKNEVKTLEYGKKRVVTSGSFVIWPGQIVEVRKRHRLSASEYLMIQVESDEVDSAAPYFGLVMQCAEIKTALVDETVAGETDGGGVTLSALSEVDSGNANLTGIEDKDQAKKGSFPGASKLVVGQRIIIPGNKAPTFIPPSGTDVVPVEKEEAIVAKPVNPALMIAEMIKTGVLKMENLKSVLQGVDLEEYYAGIRDSYSRRRADGLPANALYEAIASYLSTEDMLTVCEFLQSSDTTKAKTADRDPVIRQALVPGPTQFCVLIDENGDPETKKGPGRVWPGPNDHFRLEGSNAGIYEAYHIRVDRGLLLRVVASQITCEEMAKQLPKDSRLDKLVYRKGDEIFIGGFDAYFVPSKSVEVRNPITRQLHIGNDHSEVYVHAIGVDQDSGVYIATLETGNIALIKGEKRVLPDPRRERHVLRRIPGSMFNLMVAANEPHKRVRDDAIVETPWAISVSIPHNNAILVTGGANRRVVVGAQRELLGYKENLEVLELTQGRPKVSGNPKVATCFLRIDGNRVTDQVVLETADFVNVVVDLAYSVKFEGTSQEDMIRWFNFQNYVLFLCDNLRSRLRAAARQLPLEALYRDTSGFVRDTILGKKPEGEGQHRPGLLFEENNMRVKEVEILSVALTDADIKRQLDGVNRNTVAARLQDVSLQVELDSARNQDEVESARAQLLLNAIKRKSAIKSIQIADDLARGQEEVARDQTLAQIKAENAATLRKAEADHLLEVEAINLKREAERAEAALALQTAEQEADLKYKTELAKIEEELTAAIASADVNRLGAVQPGLVEAISGLGNSELAAALAENLPKAGGGLDRLLGGVSSMSALKQMVAGTPMGAALDALGVKRQPTKGQE